MKFTNIASKGIKEILRDKRGFTFILTFPLLYIVIFAFAFGSGFTPFFTRGDAPHEIAVINNDTGATVFSSNIAQHKNFGDDFSQLLGNVTYENRSTNLFHLNNVSEEKANEMLKSRSLDALIIIPEDFSGAFASMINTSVRTEITSMIGEQAKENTVTGPNPTFNAFVANTPLPVADNVTATLTIKGDPGYVNFGTAQAAVTGLLERYKDNVKGSAIAEASAPFGGAKSQILGDFVSATILPISGTQSFSIFDYMVPGLIIFALLIQVSIIASSLSREVQTGTLDRLKLSKMRSFDLLFGTLITWSLMTFLQVFILIIVAIAVGYKWEGGINSLLFATVIGIIAGLATISLALLVAAFVTNERQAGSLSVMIAVPAGFLAGAFFPLPKEVIAEFNGRSYQLYDLIPWTHAVTALRSVLTYGSGFGGDVIAEVELLIILTAILFVIGVAAFSRVRLRTEQ
jgi:ABC-2 type transport system permease protein